MLKFLGNGAAFNSNALNTSAYVIEDDVLILIDCGESICNRLLKLKLLEKVNKIYVFITHLHSDHIGSLEALIYYNEVFLKKDFQIFYPKKSRLKKLLTLTGVDFPFEIYDVPSSIGNFTVDCVPQKHIYGSYGYFFYGKNYSFFYSGDTSEVNSRAVAELEAGKIDRVYHEVTLTGSKIHTHIGKLEKSFKPELRNKVYLMHFNDEETIEECKSKGYSVVETASGK